MYSYNHESFTVSNKIYGIVYIIPFIIIIFAFSVSLVKKDSGAADPGQFAFLANPINLVVLGTAYVIAAGLFFTNVGIFINSIKRNWVYIVSIFFTLSTVCVSDYPVKVVINFFHFVGMTLVIVATVYYFKDNTQKLFHVLSFYTFAIIAASILTAVFFPSIGIHHRLQERWMGLTSNPNNLGDVAYIAIWISLFGIYFTNNKLITIMNFLTIIGSCICLYKANSITSSICAFFVLSAGPTFMSMGKNAAIKIFLKIFFLLLFFVLFLLILYAFFPERLGIDQVLNAVGRDASLSGRTSLWVKGFLAFKIKPVWGWGYDSNVSLMSRSVISYAQFHNGYLNVALAGGSIGFTFLLILILRQINLCKKLLVKSFELSIAFLVLLLSIMLHDVTEATFFNPTNICWLMFVFSLFYLDYQDAVKSLELRKM
ncbi:MAG: O-antigen ligase family protein [Deltaproteobacteria bacterium]|nr:O-antigen ligase family protein [Deltaproteobacteria bacterium]MBW1964874.1 O-antigen ligase family protein [Deltaproteobacteria bacterium]